MAEGMIISRFLCIGAVATALLSGCGGDTDSNGGGGSGGSGNSAGGSSNSGAGDPRCTQTMCTQDINYDLMNSSTCDSFLKNSPCIPQYSAWISCARSHDKCTADQEQDVPAVTEACQSQFDAYNTCLSKS